MDELGQAEMRIGKKQYRLAGEMLDKLLHTEPENHRARYLLALLCLKLKDYPRAIEHLDEAILIQRNAEYLKAKGMACLEIYDIQEALGAFENAREIDQKDAETAFFLAVCHLFLDDGKASSYMNMAKRIDAKKTARLLGNFYSIFLRDDPSLTRARKKFIEEKLRSV